MTDTLPEPFVPAEVDLRGLPWMPVQTERLLDSDLWGLSTGEEFKVAFRLWCKAWQQVPAASLPDDDRLLMNLAGVGRMAHWLKLRPVALRRFVRCSDGRLYHPVLAEKALEAWKHRSAQRDRANKRWHAPGNATASAAAMQGTVTGTEKRQDRKPPATEKPSAAARRPREDAEERAARNRPTRQAYIDAYRRRYSVEPTMDKRANAMLAQFVDVVGAEDGPGIAAFYLENPRGLYVAAKHDVTLLLRDARGLRTEWLTGRQVTETEARQADKSGARGNLALELLAENRKTG